MINLWPSNISKSCNFTSEWIKKRFLDVFFQFFLNDKALGMKRKKHNRKNKYLLFCESQTVIMWKISEQKQNVCVALRHPPPPSFSIFEIWDFQKWITSPENTPPLSDLVIAEKTFILGLKSNWKYQISYLWIVYNYSHQDSIKL